MARKNIVKILSGCCIVLCAVMLWTLSADASSVTVSIQKYTISGSVGVEGVEIKGFPESVITDSDGNFYTEVEYGWSGTIKPEKPGYNFSPVSKPYTNVTKDMYDQDFTGEAITYTISGKIGNMAGVEVGGLPGNVVTNNDGTYSVEVQYGWEGDIIPYKEGFEFSPEMFNVKSVQRNVVQSFTVEPIKIDITGNAGTEGAVISGLPGRVVSGKDGTFKVTVDFGWSGTITPEKEGWTFSPSDMTYSNLTTDQVQDFYAEAQQFVITGTTGLANVKMEGFPDDVYTDSSGLYTVMVDYGFSGTIKPVLPGYDFSPASKIYSKVTADKEGEDYKSTVKKYTIKGKTGLAGVTMVGLPGDPVTVGSDGSYEVEVEYSWSGTVFPEKEGYTFEPADKTYTVVAEDHEDNFRASLREITITGNAIVADVVLKGFPGTAIKTDSTGNYTATVKWGTNVKIIPTLNGYTFEPSMIELNNVTDDQYGQNFEATVKKYAISGVVRSNKGKPVPNITIDAGPEGVTTTDEQGKYTIEVPFGWTGGIMPDPYLEGYSFKPQAHLFNSDRPVRNDLRNQNFTAIIETFKISDTLEFGPGKPIPGVTITGNNGASSTVTNAKGEFTIEVPFGWTGEYTLSKPGMNFTPPSVSFTDVRSDYVKNKPVITTPPVTGGGETPPVTGGGETTPVAGGGDTIPVAGGGETTPVAGGGETIPITGGGETEDYKNNPEWIAMQERIRILEQEAEENAAVIDDISKGEHLVTNEFSGDDILTVLDILSADTGVPILYEQIVEGMVSCSLDRVPLEDALDLILKNTPYYAKKFEGDNPYYLVCAGTLESDMFYEISITKALRLNYISARDAREYLVTPFQNYVQAVDDPNERLITITAPKPVLERIVSDIMQIDMKPSQVLLEARIVVLDKGDLLNLGVEWGWPTLREGTFSNQNKGYGGVLDLAGKTAWGIQMGYTPDATFTNALEQVLNLMQVNDEAKIVAQPSIIAQDNQLATMSALNEDYYILYASGLSDTLYSRQEMEKITTGTVLTMTPHISDTNDIVLDMAVEVSDTISQQGADNLPSVRRRIAKSTIRVYDGGSVAIAGLSESKVLSSTKEVPGLSKLPIIGGLFKNDYKNETNKEVAIFVTASIVRESGQRQPGFMTPTRTVAPAAPSQIPMSSNMSQFQSELDSTVNNNAGFMTQPIQNQPRRNSAFNNNASIYEEQPFMSLPDSDTQAIGSRRRPESRRLSEEDQFNMQIFDSLSGQGSAYNGSGF